MKAYKTQAEEADTQVSNPQQIMIATFVNFIHMQVECPIGSDIRLAVHQNLGPHIYRQFEGTRISLHVERTLPYPYQSLWQKHK